MRILLFLFSQLLLPDQGTGKKKKIPYNLIVVILENALKKLRENHNGLLAQICGV